MLSLIHKRHSSWTTWLFAMVFAFAFVAMTNTAEAKKKPKKPKAPKPPKLSKAEKFEIQIMEKLIDFETRVTSDTQLADTHTTDTVVLAFAHQFVDTERVNIAAWKGFLKTYYNIDYVAKSHESEIDEEDMDGDFDHELMGEINGFLHGEIAHLRQLVRKGKHDDVKAYARIVITDDQAQISVVKSWLRANEDDEDEDEDDD